MGDHADGTPSRRSRLLIIDDDESQLLVHTAEMENRGYEAIPLHIVADNLLGIVRRAVVEHKPDAVLTDWQLNSHFSGRDVAARMENLCIRGGMGPLPVIIHSSTPEDVPVDAHPNGLLLGIYKKGSYDQINQLFSKHIIKDAPALGDVHERPEPRGR